MKIRGALVLVLAILPGLAEIASAADLGRAPAPPIPVSVNPWEGFYAGGHLGNAWAQSNWSTPGAAGSMRLEQTLDSFSESGSFFGGLQAGYNHVLPNGFLIGAVIDASVPAFPNISGFGIGNASNFVSPVLGAATYTDNVLAFGTMRGRIGYAPGNWLLYATGGFAWSRDQLNLTQLSTGFSDYPQVWRVGWVAGAGFEVPILPHWTAGLEYLFTDYGSTSTTFPTVMQPVRSNLTMHEVRAGLNYHFDDGADAVTKSPAAPDSDRFNFHAQTTFTAQGYPAIRSAYQGPNSLLPSGQAAETTDVTLYAGSRLWKGAEAWINPEIDEGFGIGNTHGVAGFPSGESYKLGSSYPYARVQRYFIRQTIDLGGESQDVDADINQFAATQTANRLVFTVGKFAIPDIFDTNKYATNPKSDFLNWTMTNAGTLDYAGDAWGYSYGAAAELYVDRFAIRGGLFDLSQTPAGTMGVGNQLAYGLDPTFHQFQAMAEVEERHELWGQPGKLKLTGFLSEGNAGSFQDALNLVHATGLDASDALIAVRHYQGRPGISINLEQQVSDSVGIFARAGWADGNVEPWDFTDVDRTISGGASIAGKSWGRPDDTWGIAGIINGISAAHAAYFQNGGLGILIGDGALTNVTVEKIFETYYSVALTPNLKVSFDYQFIADPGYNSARGPVNVGAIRIHTQF